ncbi:RAP domain-containing protein [Pycnococcus provasolii]
MSGLSGHTRRYNPRRSAEECARMLTSRIVNAQSDGALADFVEQHVGKFDEIHVSTAANKLAKLTARRHTITLSKSQRDSVLLLLEERLHDFESISARPVANLLWSCAKLGYDDGNHSMVHYLSDQVPRVVDDFNPQTLANTVWAWATMRHQPSSNTLAALERRMLACVDDFDPQDVTNTLWAWATMGHQPSDKVLDALERRMLACVDDFNPQALANTVWAWATMRHQPPAEVLIALERRMLACVDDFNPQDVANTLWAWATMRHQPSADALIALERRMLACVDDFKPQNLTNTLWAIAMLINSIEGDSITCCPTRRVMRLWGTTAIDQNVLDQLLHQLEATEFSTLEEQHFQQIFQAHHLLGDRFKPSAALLDQAREEWAKQLASRSSSSPQSSLEREVAACLDRLGIAYDVEVLTEDGMHRVDMLVRLRTDDGGERLLVIECDGPTHFLRSSDGTYRIDGSTYARNCDLRKLGLDVLCVTGHGWTSLTKDDERDAYLRRELQERDFKHSFKCDNVPVETRDHHRDIEARRRVHRLCEVGGHAAEGGALTRPTPQASASAYVPPHPYIDYLSELRKRGIIVEETNNAKKRRTE